MKYKFYATLLDAFQGYLSSSEIYQQFWGFSENPKTSEEDFEKQQFKSLIDRINRVPFESEPASKGTAFNEMIDCIIESRTSKDYLITAHMDSDIINVRCDKYSFDFPLKLSSEIALMCDGALTQQLVEGVMPTKYGNVLLYGYMDELLPFKSVDIKTTKKYNAFKYRNNWQHKVYPYCLQQSGVFIDDFEYIITDFKKIYTELYVYDHYRDFQELQSHCERFIEFLQSNRHLITDNKIFALDKINQGI
jgi:hypothetical protein